jgi:hypothetical protein
MLLVFVAKKNDLFHFLEGKACSTWECRALLYALALMLRGCRFHQV